MRSQRKSPVIEHVSWEQINEQVNILVDSIRFSEGIYKNIYGIPRGGLIVGVILSHRLGLPMIFCESDITQDTLVVDDISDSGKTLEKLMGRLTVFGVRPNVATLYLYKDSDFIPDYTLREKKQSWIVFPWEITESSKYDGTQSTE